MLLTIANLKGGVGKTTSAIMLSLGLAAQGRRVLLVDTDPQPSALKWAEMAGEAWPWDRITVVSWTNPKTLERQITSTMGEYDDAIVDVPPSRTRTGRGLEAANMEAALRATGHLLVTTSTSSIDLAEIADTFEVASDVDAVRDVLASVMLVRVKSGTRSSVEVPSVLAEEYGYPVMKTYIPDREDIAQALGKVPALTGSFAAYADALTEIRADHEEP